MAPPLIAIVGAPNVGKSTLFNRLVGGRPAIVTDEAGVTRDRLYGTVVNAPRPFRIVDTGGLTPNTAAPFAAEISRQAETAMREAVGLLFVVDARTGVSAVDVEVAGLLRRSGLPIILVANKVEGPRVENTLPALFELGLQEPVPVSAEHGIGLGLLLSRIGDLLESSGSDPDSEISEPSAQALEVAIVGRPNVGKSSLLNRLVGTERAMVSDIPGTTRDAIDTLLRIDERTYRLIDTAGVRRPGKLRRRAERYSVERTRQNVERCDVAVLVLDATQSFAAQDAHIAGSVGDAFKPLVIAVNKWDLVESREAEAKRWLSEVEDRLRFVKEPPMVLVSAKTGQRVPKLLEWADALYAAGGIRVPTTEINRWLQEAAAPQIGAQRGAGALRLFYATQTGVHPPTFLVFCNDPRRVHFSFRRYLENSLRERFGFGGAPIRLRFRGRRSAT